MIADGKFYILSDDAVLTIAAATTDGFSNDGWIQTIVANSTHGRR